MSVCEAQKIDVIGFDSSSQQVVLTVSDHLPWDGGDEHAEILQAKLNAYLAFIESGEVAEAYPRASEAVGYRIEVVGKYPPDDAGAEFIAAVQEVIEEAGFEMRFRLLEENAPTH